MPEDSNLYNNGCENLESHVLRLTNAHNGVYALQEFCNSLDFPAANHSRANLEYLYISTVDDK